MNCQTINNEFQIIDEQIKKISNDFAKINSTNVMKYFNFVDDTIVVIVVNSWIVDSSNVVFKNDIDIDKIIFFENEFVQIFNELDRRANFDV